MDSLVVANIINRPGRTLASVLGIAVGVILILVTVGLARGMLHESGERQSNLGAEILFQPPGSFGAGVATAPLAMPVAYAEALLELKGVGATTPVGRYVRSGAGGIGFELIEGVVFESTAAHRSYPEITGLQVIRGRLPQADDEVIVDETRASVTGSGIGSMIVLLGKDLRVVGIYAPEVGARIKMPLGTMQRLLGNENKCSWILVRTTGGAVLNDVASRIEASFPGNQIIFTRDIPGFYARGIPSLNVFLKVVIGLATVTSSLISLLAMYTAVTERTREIGILKSLGASKKFIVVEIEKEALVISSLGAAVGFLGAVITQAGIAEMTSLIVRLEPAWIVAAVAVALLGGALGALYPAVRAANQDPVEALAYE